MLLLDFLSLTTYFSNTILYYIIMIENGEIVQIGTYEHLKNDEGIFADFIKNYLDKNQLESKLSGNCFKW